MAGIPSREKPTNDAGWDVNTLYVHLAHRIDELEKLVEQRFSAMEKVQRAERETLNTAILSVERASAAAMAASEKAIDKAEKAATDRFSSVNEFRSTLSDQATKFVARTEVDTRINGMSEKVNDVSTRVGRIESMGMGRQEKGGETRANWTLLFGAIGMLGIILGIVMAFRK